MNQETESIESNPLQIRSDDVVVVLGKRRSGKSNLIVYLVRTLKFNFVILDVVGNLVNLRNEKNVEYYLINPDNEEKLNGILRKSVGKMVVVDEADLYNWNKHNFLNRVLQIGRNFGIGFIVAARRPANISKNLLSNSDEAFIFSFKEPRDTEYLESWLSSDTDYYIETPYAFRVFVQGEDKGLYSVDKVL